MARRNLLFLHLPNGAQHKRNMNFIKKGSVKALMVLAAVFGMPDNAAATSSNAQMARQLFDKAYGSVYGAAGASLSYSVNIVGLYKASGNICMKGKKKRFFESRYSAWCNGKDYYKVDNKKKTVEIYDADSPEKDKYSGKFAFSPNNFKYSYSENKTDYIIKLEAKPKTQGNIKHAQICIDKHTMAPKSLRIKILFFWTTIKISNFRSGGINDNIFNFPQEKFKGYKITDKRSG